MKKTILILLLGIGLSANAQKSNTQAYDLILKLIPDAGKTTSWQSAKDATKGLVTWTKATPSKEIIEYNIIGQAMLGYDSQQIKCDGKPCETSVTLSGPTTKTYNLIVLELPPDGLPAIQLEKLFGKKQFTAKIVKKEIDEGLGGVIYYEVQFPGKPLVWIQTSTFPAYREEQSNDFSITVFLSKKDMLSRM
ncbi:hypothetical protein [Flavobacterium caeni]|uniref:Uncharacterized protein n=1 Tax=Flavobacterium caeni TaxID=490189 RepID=A0A1G5GZG1_9FLAO|nr:hypothetical protein [Flavobacterium caeni]SCY56038.1 hypothetical protein SAMN02927903_01663 [Flavobacterium caeni]